MPRALARLPMSKGVLPGAESPWSRRPTPPGGRRARLEASRRLLLRPHCGAVAPGCPRGGRAPRGTAAHSGRQGASGARWGALEGRWAATGYGSGVRAPVEPVGAQGLGMPRFGDLALRRAADALPPGDRAPVVPLGLLDVSWA